MARTMDRKKLAEWQRRFARHRTSGLTVAEFCRREGVEAGPWKYWQRQVERLTTNEPRRAASRVVFQAVEIIRRPAVVVRFPGGTTLEIPDDRIDLVRLAIDRMAVLPHIDLDSVGPDVDELLTGEVATAPLLLLLPPRLLEPYDDVGAQPLASAPTSACNASA